MLRFADPVRTEDGRRRGKLSSLVLQANEHQLFALLPTHLLPCQLEPSKAKGALLSYSSGTGGSVIAHEGYISVSCAFALAPLPAFLEIDPSVARWTEQDIAAPKDVKGLRVRVGESAWGHISRIEAPAWIQLGDTDPFGYFGAIEVIPESSEDWFVGDSAGAAVTCESGRLVGFVLVADEETCMVAPAKELLEELHVRMASALDIARHNSARERSVASPSRLFGGLFDFGAKVALMPASFGRTLDTPR